MKISRGFLVSEQFVEIISRLPVKTRAAVLDYAFAAAYDLEPGKLPVDPAGVLAAVAAAITESAREFDENGGKRSKREAMMKWLKRHPGATEADYLSGGQKRTTADTDGQNRTKSDGNESTPEKKRNEMNRMCAAACPPDTPPTPEHVADWVETHFTAPRPDAEFIAAFCRRMTEGGWVDGRGRSLLHGRWQRELSAWWDQQKKNSAARVEVPAAGVIRPTLAAEVWRDE